MAKKILLADDSITIQKVIELTFSDEDFDVITVGNGRLALERLPEVRPDIVLCDIIMPEKDGYEVCEQIKSNPSWSHLPVLLLTGAFEPFDQERASRAGYDGSLAKPFEPETLIAKVKDLLARAPARPVAPPPVAVAAAPAPIVVPFARPAAMTPPPLVAAAPPPAPVAPLGSGFISDEPFPEIAGHEAEPSAPPHVAPRAPTSAPPLASLSEEESAMLSAPPAGGTSQDAASTVMFRPAELPWSAPEPVAPAAPARVEPAPAAPARVAAEPKVETIEPRLVPEVPLPLSAGSEEPPVFEAVLDEDLDFGPAGFEPEPAPEQAGGETLFAPEPHAELAPEPVVEAVAARLAVEPASSLDDLVSSGPTASATVADEPSFVEESLHPEAAPVAAFGHPPTYAAFDPSYPGASVAEPMAAPPPVPEPVPTRAPEAAPAPKPEPAPEPAPMPMPATVPAVAPLPLVEAPAAPGAASPLADLALPAEEPPATPVSQAAAFSVPVDMVEKIAQRVVAQVSEKVVREIAWEVIPDLAEALIKQEIERLKAELQKT